MKVFNFHFAFEGFCCVFSFRDWNTIMFQNCCLGVFRFSFHKKQINLNRSTFQQPMEQWIVMYFMCARANVMPLWFASSTTLNFEWEWHLQTFIEIILNSHPIQVYSFKRNSNWIKFRFEINCYVLGKLTKLEMLVRYAR